jgi:hypothetical protein
LDRLGSLLGVYGNRVSVMIARSGCNENN